MSELDVDRKRALAIGAMEAMAQDFSSNGDLDSAAGCYDEVARLVEAHAENAPDDATAAERLQVAQEFRRRAQTLRAGGQPGGGESGSAAAGVGGPWEVTWTQAASMGESAPAPGPGWEPFGITFAPLGPPVPVVGWRRTTG